MQACLVVHPDISSCVRYLLSTPTHNLTREIERGLQIWSQNALVRPLASEWRVKEPAGHGNSGKNGRQKVAYEGELAKYSVSRVATQTVALALEQSSFAVI